MNSDDDCPINMPWRIICLMEVTHYSQDKDFETGSYVRAPGGAHAGREE
jgi:hypothetical protein